MNESIARAAVDALGAAFLAGDADAVLRQFVTTGDPVYAGSEPGEVAVGRTEIRGLLEDLFSRDERYSWRTSDVRWTGSNDLLFLVADADLLVHSHPDNSAPGVVTEQVPYRLTGALEQEPAGWLWRLCQGSEPAPQT